MHVPPRSITCTARTLSPFLTFTNDLAEQTASWKHKEKHQMAARRMTDEAPKSIRRQSCIRGHNPHPFFSSTVRRPKSPVGCVSFLSLHVMIAFTPATQPYSQTAQAGTIHSFYRLRSTIAFVIGSTITSSKIISSILNRVYSIYIYNI